MTASPIEAEPEKKSRTMESFSEPCSRTLLIMSVGLGKSKYFFPMSC